MSCIDVLRHEKRDLPSSKKCTMYKDTNNSNKGWTLLLHCKIEFLCYMILLTLCRSIQFLFNFILVFKLFALVSPYEGVLSAFGPSAWQVPDLYSIIFCSINLICLWINQKSKRSDCTREKLRGEILKMMRFYCTDDVIIEGNIIYSISKNFFFVSGLWSSIWGPDPGGSIATCKKEIRILTALELNKCLQHIK